VKIAYITIIPDYSVGIIKKIREKAIVSATNDYPIDYYIVNPIYHENTNLHNLFIFKWDIKLKNIFLKKVWFRYNKFKIIEKLIKLDKYEFIVLRYPLVDGYFNKFLMKYSDKIITEHHTNEISELLSLPRFIDKVRGINEILFSPKFLRKVRGIIAVTEEIKEVELKKAGEKPSIVIPNGINVENYRYTGFKKFDGRTLKIIFIASKFEKWQGIEDLLKKFQKYKGKVKFKLYLIGTLSKKQIEICKSITNDYIEIIISRLFERGLDKLFENMNIAVSTLALYKKHMKEACPLKSREYIARGIPFVYAYKDPDLSGDEMFAKRIDPYNYSLNEIIEFSRFVSEYKDKVEEEIGEYRNKISLDKKISEMMNFINRIKRDNIKE